MTHKSILFPSEQERVVLGSEDALSLPLGAFRWPLVSILGAGVCDLWEHVFCVQLTDAGIADIPEKPALWMHSPFFWQQEKDGEEGSLG